MDETERPVFPAGADARQWNHRNREHMRAMILASAETFAVLGVEAAPWRGTDRTPEWRYRSGWTRAESWAA